jgi:hypothetical protein
MCELRGDFSLVSHNIPLVQGSNCGESLKNRGCACIAISLLSDSVNLE